MNVFPFVLAALLLALCVMLAVRAVRTHSRVAAVSRVQVPARLLATRDVDRGHGVKVGPVRVGGGGQAGLFRYELEVEYPGPDGRPMVARMITSQDHSIRAGGRVGPEFDGRSVWVNRTDPTDVAFSQTGDQGGTFVWGILSAICGGGAVIALFYGLLTSMFGGTP